MHLLFFQEVFFLRHGKLPLIFPPCVSRIGARGDAQGGFVANYEAKMHAFCQDAVSVYRNRPWRYLYAATNGFADSRCKMPADRLLADRPYRQIDGVSAPVAHGRGDMS